MSCIDDIIAKQKELADELEIAKLEGALFLVRRLNLAYFFYLLSHIRICQ